MVNYKVPVCSNREEVLDNCKRIASFIKGTKRAYPGLDLIIFPEYSTQGFHPELWDQLTTTLDGPEVAIFKEACRENGVYGIFSLTGEYHPEGKNPYNTLIMVTDQGEINHVYRKIFPWVPKEPWTAGHETSVAVGPKGLIVGGSICYDCNMPEMVRDLVFKGAELVVRIQGYMYPAKEQQRMVACAPGRTAATSPWPTWLGATWCTPTSATPTSWTLTGACWRSAAPARTRSPTRRCRSPRSGTRAATGPPRTTSTTWCTAGSPQSRAATPHAHSTSTRPG